MLVVYCRGQSKRLRTKQQGLPIIIMLIITSTYKPPECKKNAKKENEIEGAFPMDQVTTRFHWPDRSILRGKRCWRTDESVSFLNKCSTLMRLHWCQDFQPLFFFLQPILRSSGLKKEITSCLKQGNLVLATEGSLASRMLKGKT